MKRQIIVNIVKKQTPRNNIRFSRGSMTERKSFEQYNRKIADNCLTPENPKKLLFPLSNNKDKLRTQSIL